MIQTMTPRPPDKIQRELSVLADGLFTALDELREISHGIHPAVLSEAGLGPALGALARRSAVPVELDLNLGSPLGQQAEAAAYYIASEALANAAKHAQASVIDLRVRGHAQRPHPLYPLRRHRRRRPKPRHGHHRPQRPGRGPRRNNLGPQPARPRNDPARPAPGRPRQRGPRGRRLARRHRYRRRQLPSRSLTRRLSFGLPVAIAPRGHAPVFGGLSATLFAAGEGFRQVGASRYFNLKKKKKGRHAGR